MNKIYTSFCDLSMEYNLDDHTFNCYWSKTNCFLKNGKIAEITIGSEKISLIDYKKTSIKVEKIANGQQLTVNCSQGPKMLNEVSLCFILKRDCINFFSRCRIDTQFLIEGNVCWGADPENSTFAVCLNKQEGDIRVGVGPATARIDNALFDRENDRVIEFLDAETIRLSYDWKKHVYTIISKTGKTALKNNFCIKIHENYYHKKFGISYKSVNKQFNPPPVGWMTWYSIQFDASEETILAAADWMNLNLQDYGADYIWVDWEWLHSDMSGHETDGVSLFSPNGRYPRGMLYLSNEIRARGCKPALWVAINDVNENPFFKEYPDAVLSNDTMWCGNWWADPTYPAVIDTYIPKIFKQITDWGYDAIKWDCLYHEFEIGDKYHDDFYDKSIITDKAYEQLAKVARETIGEERYFLLVAGGKDRDINFGTQYFDAARIGNDVFNWDEFITNSVRQIQKYFCYHNIVFHADLDNVILREELNTIEQAKSRASLVSLTGTPFTMGDNLLDLPEERIEIIKKSIPLVTTHPMDLEKYTGITDVIVINMAVERSFESWNIVDVFNTKDEMRTMRVDFSSTLHFDTTSVSEYLVFEYWSQEFIGILSEGFVVQLKPFESKVFSVRKKIERPQIVSTNRHLTQGVCDLTNVFWSSDTQKLSGKSKIIKDRLYKIYIHCPEGFEPVDCIFPGEKSIVYLGNQLFEIGLKSISTGESDWDILFV